MSAVPLFKNRHGNVAVVKGNNTFNFNSGRFFTTDPVKIRILLDIAERRDQGVYIDPREPEIDPDAATPMEVMKKRIIAEYLASQKEVKDAGTSAPRPLNQTAMNTAASPVMGNGLAELVADAAVQEALGTEAKDDHEKAEPEVKASPVAASMSPALSALEKLKK